jgi:hypothetical protein
MIVATDVPAEFRRVELFISGTLPTPRYATETEIPQYDPDTGELIERPTPTPHETPIGETWEDGAEPPGVTASPTYEPRNAMTSVYVCPLTGMRATSNCPERERRMFRRGTEPKEFCTFHVNPPR